jgi:hypothetical protein
MPPDSGADQAWLYRSANQKEEERQITSYFSDTTLGLTLKDGKTILRQVQGQIIQDHLDQRVTEPEEYDWPDSQRQSVAASARMTVSIDGTYVRADSSGWSRQHYVVAGRIERDGQLGDRFAWIARRRTDPVDFMKATLENIGWTSASRVAVLADGADGLTSLVDAATSTPAVGVLDWFHISMRFRPIEQMIPKVALLFDAMSPTLAAMIRVKLPRTLALNWRLRQPWVRLPAANPL